MAYSGIHPLEALAFLFDSALQVLKEFGLDAALQIRTDGIILAYTLVCTKNTRPAFRHAARLAVPTTPRPSAGPRGCSAHPRLLLGIYRALPSSHYACRGCYRDWIYAPATSSLRRVAFRGCVGSRAFRSKPSMHGIKGDRSVSDVCLTGSFTSDLAGDCTSHADDPFRGDSLPRESCMGGIRGRDVACRRREAALSHSSSRGVLATAKCAIAENRCSATWLVSATRFWRKRAFASWRGRLSRRLAEAASAAANRSDLST